MVNGDRGPGGAVGRFQAGSHILTQGHLSYDLKLIPDLARQLLQVTECYRITGEDCYFFKLYLRSIEELEPILDRFTPLGRTTTSIVDAIPVPRRAVLVPGHL